MKDILELLLVILAVASAAVFIVLRIIHNIRLGAQASCAAAVLDSKGTEPGKLAAKPSHCGGCTGCSLGRP
ncbi:hypothetical protein MASR2M78_23300 [Treponema sp.]